MDVTDPRRRAAERKLAPAPNGTLWPARRAAFHNAVRIGFELMDRQHARVRSFRNIVLATALGLMLLVVAICLVAAHAPHAFPLCFGPTPTSAPGGEPQLVEGPAGVACPSEESPPTPGTQPRRLPAAGDVTWSSCLACLAARSRPPSRFASCWAPRCPCLPLRHRPAGRHPPHRSPGPGHHHEGAEQGSDKRETPTLSRRTASLAGLRVPAARDRAT